MKPIFLLVALASATRGLQSRSEVQFVPAEGSLVHFICTIQHGISPQSAPVSIETVNQERGFDKHSVTGFTAIGYGLKQMQVLLKKQNQKDSDGLWVWDSLQSNSPVLIFDPTKWKSIPQKLVSFSPCYDLNYTAATDSKTKVWLLDLRRHHIVNGFDIGFIVGKGSASVLFSPDGEKFALSVSDGDPYLSRDYWVDVETRAVHRFGAGKAISWIDNDRLLCEQRPGPMPNGANAVIFGLNGSVLASHSKISAIGMNGGQPMFLISRMGLDSKIRPFYWVETWDKSLASVQTGGFLRGNINTNSSIFGLP